MTDPIRHEYTPPYAFAALITLLVLVGYVVSLAPSVTWWDAGEFITAARTLGIPHPPGTPLFVLIAHLWGALIPVGEYAVRLNFLSALFSAIGAGAFFLLAYETLRGADLGPPSAQAEWLRLGGAAAAAVAGAFTFTQWQNSNETEVYAVAVCTIALMAWLCLVWRRHRREGRPAARWLVLTLYLAGLSIGCHLLALLAGPAVVAFIWSVLRSEPAETPEERGRERAILVLVGAAWFTLIGTGLGSNLLMTVGGACLLLALANGLRRGSLSFGLLAIGLAAVGVTVYYAAFIRAGLHPAINESQPDNWNSLLAVIRRAQYPVRTPLDNPMMLHGPNNSGRTLGIFGLQLANYFQYFDWQWANGLEGGLRVGSITVFGRLVFTILFGWLGLRGLRLQYRSDRSLGWLCIILFLTTGLALVVYMNFKIGNGMAWDRFPQSDQHEVRDRDYFFVVSFVIWGLWAGLALAGAAKALLDWRPRARLGAGLVLSVALLPLALNFSAATRRHGADARLPADFAYDLLNSVPPYGILFTYGDNDSFPLWWAQEVAGIRQDVTVVCLALAQTDWYMRQIRDRVPGDFDEAMAPDIWRDRHPVKPAWPLHLMTDEQIASSTRAIMLSDSQLVQIGPVRVVYPARSIFYPNDLVTISILQQNLGRRPVVWALTAADHLLGLEHHVVMRGLVLSAEATVIDSTTPGVDAQGLFGAPVDVPVTRALVTRVYRYAGLLGPSRRLIDPTSRGVAANLAVPWTRLASYYDRIGNGPAAIKSLETAGKLSAQPGLEAALAELRLKQAQSAPQTDSTRR
ncbi:MAG: DUF2723 domain-containing protein [Gemmatimonadota bacterium]